MKKAQVYLNSKGVLYIDFFKTLDDENPYKILKGKEANEFIKRLSTKQIVDIYDPGRFDSIELEYGNAVVALNELELLKNKRVFSSLIKNISSFYTNKEIKQIKNKKVTRKNKYSSKKIIASALVALVLSGCAYNALSKINEQPLEVNQISFSTEYEDTEKFNFNEIIEIQKEKKLESKAEETKEIIPVSINYNDRSDLDKVYITKSYYWDLIEKYSKEYGLDPNLVLAIATQERGVHSTTKDRGGATGLMQIQNSVWENEYITAYNFNTNKRETFYITPSKIQDLYTNVKIGCMYLQNCMDYMNYNPVAAVQCYNMGHGSMMKILRAYAKDTNRTVDEVLNDKNDIGWMDYRNIIDKGDQNYIENVFSWLGKKFEISNQMKGVKPSTLSITNQMNTKKIY